MAEVLPVARSCSECKHPCIAVNASSPVGCRCGKSKQRHDKASSARGSSSPYALKGSGLETYQKIVSPQISRDKLETYPTT
jgi:hypothetical protein